ncbi:spore germination protein [Bacillus sp. 31A1R]|uniref:Spore germination protein n=1 Tax=Robertmurraya mangrovi TaxID=3098077 RepID=A0ABU5J3Q6_9BACI|nr:spore germination protein [Bacillus sp. 31A1R]MDZ5474039.1 spore germination protein [Bacillus sp. 31A1R]
MSLRQLLFRRKKNKQANKTTEKELFQDESIEKNFYRDLETNKSEINKLFVQTFDFEMKDIKLGKQKACICYLESMLDTNELSNKVLNSINKSISHEINDIETVRDEFFPTVPYQYVENLHQVTWNVLNGQAVLLVDGITKALTFKIGGTEQRAITEPSTQTILRGPKDGFIEDISTNISLIRKRIKNPRLKFERYHLGTDTKTTVNISYIENITNQDILDEVRKRIKKIEVGGVLDSGNIEEFITDKTLTPFPLVFNTERPDTIAGHLLEGKVAIMIDGSPFALSVPGVLVDFFESSEDYYQPYFMASFIRMVRYISFMIALVLPSLYVALSTYHHELMPTQLLISIQAQREGVPFPAVIEILVMELTFEILREAGIRMPRAVGQTVSIVGALVIGQAAVEAGLVSNVLVIIVALTAIASFVSPIYNFSISTRLLRFILILMAAGLGLYGILLFLILMVIHLVSLRSFGIPYLTPVAPFQLTEQKDVFVRFPIWSNKRRPTYLKTKSPIKIKGNPSPSPPTSDNG